MALRTIRIQGDAILTKNCKPVKEMTPMIHTLITDMLDTMYESGGVGLAAPQVGILKQIFVIDIGDGPFIFINPEIIETEGKQVGDEGCLSLPGKCAVVERPMKVKIKALDEKMEEFVMEGEELMARAMCHENDHLSGHMYTEIAIGPLRDSTYSEEEYEEMEEADIYE